MPPKHPLSLNNLGKKIPELENFQKQEMERVEQVGVQQFFRGSKVKGGFVPKRMAEYILEKNSFITFTDNEEIYWYDELEGLWKANGENRIKEFCTKTLKDEARKFYANETVSYIKNVTYKDRKIFDNQPINLLPLKNGVLDLTTKNLLPYSPELYFTSKLPIVFDSNADCPNIKKFLDEIVSQENKKILLEYSKYCLEKNYRIHKALMMIGGGANGKSTFSSLLSEFLGRENVSSVSLQEFGRNRFASANLYRKLANIFADLPSEALTNSGNFKALTGNDLITAEKKFQNPFQFKNYAKLIFSANTVPYVSDNSDAYFRRWIIVDFPNKFEGDKADKNILQKLCTPEELSGFLNLLLQTDLQDEFSYSKTTDEIRQQYVKSSDPISAFVMEMIEKAPDGWETKEKIYNAYCEYCRRNNMAIASDNTFFKSFRQKVSVEDYRPKVAGEGRLSALRGISLRDWVNPVNDVGGKPHFNKITDFKKTKIEKSPDIPDSPDTTISYEEALEQSHPEYKEFKEKSKTKGEK